MCLFDHTCAMRRPSKAFSKRLPGPLLGLSIMVRPLSKHGRPPTVHGPGCDLIKGCWPPLATMATVAHYGHHHQFSPNPSSSCSRTGNGNIEASAFNNFNSSFCFNVSKKEANIGNESKQGETSQSNLELWTEFETAFPDPADSKC